MRLVVMSRLCATLACSFLIFPDCEGGMFWLCFYFTGCRLVSRALVLSPFPFSLNSKSLKHLDCVCFIYWKGRIIITCLLKTVQGNEGNLIVNWRSLIDTHFWYSKVPLIIKCEIPSGQKHTAIKNRMLDHFMIMY